MITKRLVSISLSANIVLAGALGYSLRHGLVRTRPMVQAAVSQSEPQAVRAAPEPFPSPSSAESPSFRWSQLESPDYPTYIANLRGIECPEATICDIIAADLESLYEQKRREVAARGLNSLDLARELDGLRSQQRELLVRLLGLRNRSEPTTVQSSAAESDARDVPANSGAAEQTTQGARLAVLPVSVLPPDPSLKLTPDQKEDWEDLSKEFVVAIGGPNQDPKSPEYLVRWTKAQALFDARFKTLFGEALYLKAAQSLPASEE